ncbi:MAG TPA: hypothetical protein VN025_01970 [Candidatus Dormibacteraeota bacterium]|nr:hypothetical protein [Candidatus Dormibacteraeota bacterium]
MRRKLDWKRELDKKELKYGVLILLLYLAVIMMATSGCSRRSIASADNAAGKPTAKPAIIQKSANTARVEPHFSTRALSGRQLTIEKHAQKKETTRHFDDTVYGVSFDFPKNYELEEGDLPDMDRGLGYLGKIPMEFSTEGGVRLATIEVPRTAHPGTDFVNAFLTVSVFPNVTEAQCAEFSPTGDGAPTQTRKIDGVEFHMRKESAAASMHQYAGTYLHGYAEQSCYEIGYGIATAGYGSMDGIKKVNNQAVLQRLEKILDSLTINPSRTENSEPSQQKSLSEK